MQPDRPYKIQALNGKRGELNLTAAQFKIYEEKGLFEPKRHLYTVLVGPKELPKVAKEIVAENKAIIKKNNDGDITPQKEIKDKLKKPKAKPRKDD